MHAKNILHRDLKLENILIQGQRDLNGYRLYEAAASVWLRLLMYECCMMKPGCCG